MAKSWSHRFVRHLIRPLAGTSITPNHITALRAITGAMACLAFAWGTRRMVVWGGVVWVLSALLDRADGELARLSNTSSLVGQLYDYFVDICVNVTMFVAVGIGLRHGPFGIWAIMLGSLCGACLFLCLFWSEEIERNLEPGAIVLGGAGGFDPDDLFYLIGPFAWAGAFPLMLLSGIVVLAPAAAVIGIWYWHVRRRARLRLRPRHSDTQTRNV
jgi:archaetidylinositol phosphate synthase